MGCCGLTCNIRAVISCSGILSLIEIVLGFVTLILGSAVYDDYIDKYGEEFEEGRYMLLYISLTTLCFICTLVTLLLLIIIDNCLIKTTLKLLKKIFCILSAIIIGIATGFYIWMIAESQHRYEKRGKGFILDFGAMVTSAVFSLVNVMIYILSICF